MPKIQIPPNESRRHTGIFPGEFFGTIFSSKNIDLQRNPGKVTLGDSLSAVFNSSSDSDLTTPVSFVRTAADGTDRWWANAGKLFKTTNTDPETGWTQDAISSSPTSPLYDMIEFADALLVATATDIDRLASGTWDTDWWSDLSGDPVAMTANPHRFEIFSGALLITDGRFINDYDGTIGRDPALTLPADFIATWMKATASYVYIGTQSTTNREAEVFAWDRASSTFNARYGVEDTEALAGFVAYGIPYIITKKGAIKRFTGQGFRTVQEFPTLARKENITDIHPNGVSVKDNLVKINVNFGAINDLRKHSGIWTFDADAENLYHSNSAKNSVSSNDYSQQELAATGALVATSPTQGLYLQGQQVYTAYSGTTRYEICTFDESSTSNRGYFITTWIPAQDVRAFWSELFPIIRRLDTSTDRVRVAYQIKDSNTLPAYETITWTSTTTFTGSNSDVAAGDFVDILAGPNAGALAKITSITPGTPNTYTIDLTLAASSGTSRARYLPFKDLGTISSQAIQRAVFRISKKSEKVRFLVELRGTETSPQLEAMLLSFDNVKF